MKLEGFGREEQEAWIRAARSWYTRAADMVPDVGRIQYHLAILARPYLLLQLFYHTKSLASVRSFSGTRQRIQELFDSPLDNRNTNPKILQAFVSAHGALFNRNADSFLLSSIEFLSSLDNYITRIGPLFLMQGVYIASCNFAAMLEYNTTDALLKSEFSKFTRQPDWTSDPQSTVSEFVALESFVFYRSFFAFQTM